MLTLSDDARILRLLRESESHLSRGDLAVQANMESQKVNACLESLGGAGYEIEDRPHAGLRFISAPDRLIADDIAARLGDVSLFRDILVFQQTDSTNDAAARLGRGGAAEGIGVFAESQSAGRGRMGRRWESSQALGLWFSLLLRPRIPFHQWPRLTTWAAVGVAEGIEAFSSCRVFIKWPNDILIDSLKLAGILTETHVDLAGNSFAIVGIGVNVNHTPEDFPPELREKAASLRSITGRPWDRQEAAAAILKSLDRLWPAIAGDFAYLVAAARKRSCLEGRQVEIRIGQLVLRGCAESLDDEGALLLREPDGKLTAVSTGEASVLSWQEVRVFSQMQDEGGRCWTNASVTEDQPAQHISYKLSLKWLPYFQDMRVLVIDDDRELCGLIGDYLQPLGYDVATEHTGGAGLERALAEPFSAVILDLMLPGMDGFEVLKRLRKGSDVPVLMLTARGDETDRIVGLEMGADDYLPKTFSSRELLARLRAVTRRTLRPTASVKEEADIVVGPLRITPAARVAVLADAPLRLTPLEFDLLVSLARSPGRVKTREHLIQALGDRSYDGLDRSIDVHIWALRRKLGDDPKMPRFIRTVRASGYMLINADGA